MFNKLCKSCNKEKRTEEFSLCYITKTGKEVVASKCKTCMSKYAKQKYSTKKLQFSSANQ